MGNMQSTFSFMILFNIFIAVYLLYYAIKGTGKIYENEYPTEMKESHNKLLRKFCWITGVPLLVLSILEYASQKGISSIWGIISIVYVLGCVVVYFVLFRVRYKDYLKDPRKNVPKK
ncbi:MAG: hypothetical protein RR625_01850 [Christensenellaceae bacterium]